MKTLVFPWAAAAVLVLSHASAQDTEPPQVVGVSITPSLVDVSAGPATITVTIHITDNESGFDHGNIYLYDPTKSVDSASIGVDELIPGGDNLDGEYEVTLTVPRYSVPSPSWRLGVYAEDGAGNPVDFGEFNVPFPVPEDATFEVVNTSGQVDSTAPVLTEFSASETDVNTVDGPVDLDFTIGVSEELSGFKYGFIYAYNPAGDYVDYAYFGPGQLLPPGDEFEGTYLTSLTLPQGSRSGNWRFVVLLRDWTGNVFYGGDIYVNVTGGGPASSAFLAKALDAAQFSWTSADAAPWIYQTINTYDDTDAAVSGVIGDNETSEMRTTVTGPGTLHFHWAVVSEEDADYLTVEVPDTSETHQISGDSDWLAQSVTIPAGDHEVVWTYSKNGSDSFGADRGWVDRVSFEADSGDELPRLQGLDISSRSVDVSEGSRSVDFVVEASDDFEGLDGGEVRLYDPSDVLQESYVFGESDLIDSDGLFNEYAFSVDIPDDSEPGQWRVEVELREADTSEIRTYGGSNEAFPCPGAGDMYVWDGVNSDGTPPRLREFELSPKSVDVSNDAGSLTLTLRITDLPAGFEEGSIDVFNHDGKYTGTTVVNAGSLISGDEFDGIYQVTLPVPQYAEPGTWSVTCYLRDVFGNERNHPIDLPFDFPETAEFVVTNSGPIDTITPYVTALSLSTHSVNTTAGSAEIVVNVSLADDLSGLRDAFLYVYNPSDEFQGEFFTDLQQGHQLDGNNIIGDYQVTITIPQGSVEGQWAVRFFLRDRVGHNAIAGDSSHPFSNPADGLFTVSSAAPSLYQAYVSGYSLSGPDALLGGDSDHDGRINAVELMLGTSPIDGADAGAGLIQVTRDTTALYLDFTVDPTLTAVVNGDFLELRDGGGGAPLKVTGQTQDGLSGNWTNVAPTLVNGSTWRVSRLLAGGPLGFLRLSFEDP